MLVQEGALGAKLTGGGNGGCIIALAQSELHSKQLSEKLKQYGAQSMAIHFKKSKLKEKELSQLTSGQPFLYIEF